MTENSYKYNSAKLLLIATVVMAIANVSLLFAEISPWFKENLSFLAEKLPSLSFFFFTVMSLIALNGEGIGYRRSRKTGKKKLMTRFKLFVGVIFFFMYLKTPLMNRLLKFSPITPGGALLRIGASILIVVFSYSFLLFLISIHLRVRDKEYRSLAIIDNAVIGISIFYELYRIINYAIDDFGVDFFGGRLSEILSSNIILDVLCVIQFAAFVFMFSIALRCFSNAEALEEDKEAHKQNGVTAGFLLDDCGYGIDTQDDRWLLNSQE